MGATGVSPLLLLGNMWQLIWRRGETAVWGQWFWLLLAVVLGGLAVLLPPLWLGAVLAITAVFLLTLIEPLLGLGVALLLGPLGAWESLVLGGSVLDSGQLVLLLTLAVWLGRGLRNGRLFIPKTFLTLPLALFVFVGMLSLLDAPSLPFGLRELVKWVEIGLVMLLVVDCGREAPTRFAWLLTGALLLAGLSQALGGFWQFALRGDGPAHFLINGRFYRAYGTFMQPNPFGGFVNLMTLLALGVTVGLLTWVWQQRRWSRWPLLALLGAAISTGLLVLGLISSWSRGAWLGFAAGGVVLGLFWPRRRWQGAVVLGGITAVFLLALSFNLVPAAIGERLTSFGDDFRLGDVRGVDVNDSNYAVVERLAHWQAALGMARDQLWLGVGFGNYEAAYSDYALINWTAALGHAHNYYLNLLAEVGVVGLLAYGVLWTAVFWQTIRLLAVDWPQRGIVLGLLAVWVGLSVHHLVDKLYVNNIYIHLGVMFGLLQLLDPRTD